MSLKPNLSFEIIPTFDTRLLIIADTSDWKHLIDEPTYIDITLPGSKNEITHPFQKSVLNKYNSGNLAYGCTVNCEDDLVDLPDGIYKIKVYVCEGNKFSKEGNYLRTVLTELRLYKVIVNMNLECNPNSACINQIMHIKLLLEGAKADILFGNIKSAKAKFDKAVDLLEDLEHCDCKVDC
jgi:hypothetical protein